MLVMPEDVIRRELGRALLRGALAAAKVLALVGVGFALGRACG